MLLFAGEITAKVCDYIGEDGVCRSDLLFAHLPLDCSLRILGYPLARVTSFEDRRIWKHSANGNFESRSAYLTLLQKEGKN